MKRILLTISILYSFYGWSQNAAIAVPHAFQGTHYKTFKEQGETIRTWYEVSGRYDEGYTAVKIESRGWIYILIQSNAGISESKIQAREKEPRD
ncbi:MAG: hypothetical protein EBZ16_07375 [Flavobacteriia bacterium]|nr:hypothetical protein [Flavobacteriia bacterium]